MNLNYNHPFAIFLLHQGPSPWTPKIIKKSGRRKGTKKKRRKRVKRRRAYKKSKNKQKTEKLATWGRVLGSTGTFLSPKKLNRYNFQM